MIIICHVATGRLHLGPFILIDIWDNTALDEPKAFPLHVRLLGSNVEEIAAERLPEENPEGGFRLSLKSESEGQSIQGRDFSYGIAWRKL